MKRKGIAALAAAVAVVAMSTTTAFAHCGGHGGRHRSQVTYSICNVEGCQETYNHMHDGCYYYGHYEGDGHVHDYSQCPNGGYCQNGCYNHC